MARNKSKKHDGDDYYERVARIMYRMHERLAVGRFERVLTALVEANGEDLSTYRRTLSALHATYPSASSLREDVKRLEALMQHAVAPGLLNGDRKRKRKK